MELGMNGKGLHSYTAGFEYLLIRSKHCGAISAERLVV